MNDNLNFEKITPNLVTIAIPAYKRRWLGEAIESALSQDYANIELLVIDDHSPQNLREVVEPYLIDSRVKYYLNEKNLGRENIVHNWNRCLELAKGEFFVLLCDDDVLMPNFVSVLLEMAEKYPLCNVFHGRRMFINENSVCVNEDIEWPEYEEFPAFFHNVMMNKRCHTITEFMYRRGVMNGGYAVLPCGYYSDDISVLNFAKKGGIASYSNCVYVQK